MKAVFHRMYLNQAFPNRQDKENPRDAAVPWCGRNAVVFSKLKLQQKVVVIWSGPEGGRIWKEPKELLSLRVVIGLVKGCFLSAWISWVVG